MNEWTIQPARPDTLDQTVALLSGAEEAARRLQMTRDNVAAGRVKPEQFQLLSSARGVEGVCLIPLPPAVPLLPRLRADVPEAAAQAFLAHLRGCVAATPDRRLILDDTQGPLLAGLAQAAGWQLQEEAVIYETDLQVPRWVPDPQAQHLEAAAVASPEVRVLLRALDRPDFALRDGWTLVGLPETDGTLAALGATGPGGRPGTAGLDLIGVYPAVRGQGLGRRLHGHLLSVAAQSFSEHMGGTDAHNHPMRRIFERHGGVLAQQQLIFTQP
ncbi:GNAT family N-acetyltransferase [Deinococcus aquaedulcis]|uniref:GNAT family N-acetyltransferase n=1 Tax=Deinococcus aquaedulcis TaxID=2840455 RepID=UPI001C8376AC|nr:GNAT family N-acetyltransferase [Deinococcus aquaedulcis]